MQFYNMSAINKTANATSKDTRFRRKYKMVYRLVFNNSAEEMARITEVTPQTIHNHTTGKQLPNANNLQRLYVHGVNINWLFDDADISADNMFRKDKQGEKLRNSFYDNAQEIAAPY